MSWQRAQREMQSELSGFSGQYNFPFLSPSKIPDGRYYFRLLGPHPAYCPDDPYHLQVTHGVYNKNALFEADKVVCNRPLGNECYICDLLDALNHNQKFRQLDKAVQEKMAMMFEFYRYRFATAWYVDAEWGDDDDDGKSKKKIIKFKSDPSISDEQGFIFDVYQKTIIDKIIGVDDGSGEFVGGIMNEFPNLCHREKGRVLLFSKHTKNRRTTYDVQVGKQVPLRNLDLLTKYPKLNEFDSNITMSYDSQKTLVINCEIAKYLDRVVKLADINEGGGSDDDFEEDEDDDPWGGLDEEDDSDPADWGDGDDDFGNFDEDDLPF